MATAKRLPSGNWRVQVYAGKDISGKKQYRSFTAPTKREAEYAALQFTLHYREITRDTAAMTLEEGMAKYISSRDGVLSPATIRGYETIRRHHLPGLANRRLRELTPTLIQEALNLEAKEHTPKTVRNVYGLLTATLRQYHPQLARDLEQHPPTLPQKLVHEQTVLEPDQVGVLLRAVQGNPIEIPVLLAVWMGLRQSEILGLCWDSVDFQRHTLYIHQARVRNSSQELVLKTTKTTASTRTLRMPEYIETRLLAAQEDADGPFVVNMTGSSLYSRFKTVLRHEGLPPIRFHDLRHCNCSIMLSIGVPEFYAQRRGGWATGKTMKRVYTHLLDSRRSAVDDTIDSYFSALIPQK